MEVIGHQTEAEELQGVVGFRSGEQVKKGGIGAILLEDRRAAIVTVEDMIGMASELSTRNTRHENNSVGERWTRRQVKSSPSLFLCHATHNLRIQTVGADKGYFAKPFLTALAAADPAAHCGQDDRTRGGGSAGTTTESDGGLPTLTTGAEED